MSWNFCVIEADENQIWQLLHQLCGVVKKYFYAAGYVIQYRSQDSSYRIMKVLTLKPNMDRADYVHDLNFNCYWYYCQEENWA